MTLYEVLVIVHAFVHAFFFPTDLLIKCWSVVQGMSLIPPDLDQGCVALWGPVVKFERHDGGPFSRFSVECILLAFFRRGSQYVSFILNFVPSWADLIRLSEATACPRRPIAHGPSTSSLWTAGAYYSV